MREILFRGKDIYSGEWVYGYPCEYPFGRWPCKPAIVPKQNLDEGEHKFVEIDGSTLGQFTGLTDKNGKKIFEWDILHLTARLDSENAVVIFEDGEFHVVPAQRYKTYISGCGYRSIQ